MRLVRDMSAALLLAALLVIACLPLSARADAPLRIIAVGISGNARTKDSVVLTLAKVKPGDAYIEGLEKDVERRLLNTRMFYDVKVETERDGNGVRLRVRLKDKWSLFPFPMVSVRDGESRYGVSVMESNLLGYHKRLFGTVFYERGRLSETISYFDKNVLDSRYIFYLSLRNTDILRAEWDTENKINAYYQSDAGADIGAGYTFEDTVSVTLGHKLHYFKYEDHADTVRRPIEARESMTGLSIGFDKADHMEDFTKGFIGRLQFERDAGFLGSELTRTIINWRMSLYLNPYYRHNLVLTNSGRFGRGLPYGYFFKVSDMRGYERDRFDAEKEAVSTVEYRVPVRSFREANLSFVAFVDNAIFKNQYQGFTLKESKSDAGVSMRVYLRRMTLPVFQVYSVYGFSNRRILSGVTLGLAF